MKKQNPDAKILICGCASENNAKQFEKDGVVYVSGTAKKDLLSLLPESGVNVIDIPKSYEELGFAENVRTRAYVKIQDGCNNFCSYCLIPYVRGRSRSRALDKVVEEVRSVPENIKEIVLTGINLGSYREGDMRLADLLRCLMKAVDEEFPADSGLGVVPRVRFRVSSIEPRDVDDDLIELMAASNGRICRHLHLPLQSGSSKVLREMRRPYSAERFLGLVEKLYAAMPQLSLSTDVIVGFPGETEEDFLETCRVAEACHFSKMHIFRYSKRAGTPAAERDDQISPEAKAERAKRLEAIEERLRADDMRIGTG